MSENAKALVPAIAGVVLLVAGGILNNEILYAIGGSLLGVSPIVWRVPNKPPVTRKGHIRKGIPSKR